MKTTQKQRDYANRYYVENKEKCREATRKSSAVYFNKYPWLKHFYNARNRCRDIKAKTAKYYALKGIKFLISRDEIEFLWKRDRAAWLKRPSFDRKNAKKNYTLSNCRFIELSMNCSLGPKWYKGRVADHP
jgi:hypothetical protein